MGGKYTSPDWLKSNLENHPEINQSLLDEFKMKDGVKTYPQLPEYGDFQRFDLAIDIDLAPISKRIYGWFPKPSRLTRKRRLFNAQTPKKLFKAIREIAMADK